MAPSPKVPLPNSDLHPHHQSILERVKLLGQILDNAIEIPGTGYRIGLDPFLGLLPVGGDTIGAMLSAYIVLEAARLGVPKASLGRMVLNLLLDAAIGIVPVLGDLLDVTWKANAQNLKLLEAHATQGTLQRQADRTFLLLLGVGLGMIVVLIGAVFASVTLFLWTLFKGLFS